MKPITIVFNNEERRHVVQFDNPVYFEVTYPGFNYFIIITEQETEQEVEIPINVDFEDSSLLIIMSEDTDFDVEAQDLVYDEVQEWMLQYFINEEKYLDADELAATVSRKLRALAIEVANKRRYSPSKKQAPENLAEDISNEE